MDSKWFFACQGILQLFQSRKSPELTIEILDERGLVPTRSATVDRNHPLVAAWPTLKPEFMEVLGLRDWLALELFMRRKGEERAIITIVVTIDENSTSDWSEVREGMITILDRNQFQEVAVEIVRGTIWRGAGSNRQILDVENWKVPAKLGGSIGPAGRKEHPSTLGGFLELNNGQGWKTFGVTCFHCVAPEDCGFPWLLEWQQYGIRPSDARNTLKMDHPSLGDMKKPCTPLRKTSQAYPVQLTGP
jgi:hypothetical protein